MARVTFINLFDSLDEALSEKSSPQIDQSFHTPKGIQLMPNSDYPYIQCTDSVNGIELEDWTVNVVQLCNGQKTDITTYFEVERVYADDYGIAQFEWSLTNVPYDFGYRYVYLEVNQSVGETFYSNLFQLTANNPDEITRLDYKDKETETMLSIGLRMWFWQELKKQEIGSYYQTSTKNTVITLVKSQKFEKWATDVVSNNLFLKITDLFENKYIYADLYRCNLFEALEVSEYQSAESYKQNFLKLSFNKSDTFLPTLESIFPTDSETIVPTITLDSMVFNTVSAVYSFNYENFLPGFLTFERKLNSDTDWISDNSGIASPQYIPFTGTGLWDFRIKSPEATSNTITQDLSAIVIANDDVLNIIKGATAEIDVLFNDTLSGDTIITEFTAATNGIITIIEDGKKLKYFHNDTETETDSFTYTISNGTTTSTATVHIAIRAYTVFKIVRTPALSSGFACIIDFRDAEVFFYNGSISPKIGDTVFDDYDESLIGEDLRPFNGNDLWYHIDNDRVIRINNDGLVTDKDIC